MMKQELYHMPVLLRECIDALAVKPEGVYLDCTLGGGGHFRGIVERLDERGTAIGIDRDGESIQRGKDHSADAKPRLLFEQCRFSAFDMVLKKYSIQSVDGILIDLGVSSRQIDDLNRGFSYRADTKLDMRMNPEDTVTAEKIISRSTEEELAAILNEYGDIQNPRRMANAIASFSRARAITTSGDLRECLENEYGAPVKYKVLSKVFQALRIAVNNELDEIRACLSKTLRYLVKGGRLAVIAYHSLEDRIVKNFMRDNERRCVCPPHEPLCRCQKPGLLRRVNRKAIRASRQEIQTNNRARSAVLRVAEKVTDR